MITVLFAQHFHAAQRYFARQRIARTITALAFVAVILGLAALMYALFFQGLTFVTTFHESSSAVSLYMYELTLLTVMGLMFASALISGVARLFQGSYDFWIMASPSYASLPWYVFLNIFLSSLWPLIVIGLPALLSIQNVFHIGFAALAISILALAVLSLFTIAAAMALLLAITWTISKIGIKHASRALIIVIIAIFMIGAAIFWQELRGISDVANLFPGITAPATAEVGTSKVVEQFQYFPSHPVAEVFFASEQSNLTHTLFFLTIAVLLALASLLIFAALAHTYLPLWQSMQEHSFVAGTSAPHRKLRSYSFSSKNQQTLATKLGNEEDIWYKLSKCET